MPSSSRSSGSRRSSNGSSGLSRCVATGRVWRRLLIKQSDSDPQMLIVAIHEFSHAATGCCTGAKIKSISLDPREGGVTMMAGGIAAITLPAGYLGSVGLRFGFSNLSHEMKHGN